MHEEDSVTKIFTVAMLLQYLLGSQVKVPGGYYSAECNLKIFDLSTDEICTILETIDLKGFDHEESGLQLMTTYEIQGGGRMFPPVSRETVAQAMKGVDVLVAVVSAFQLNWVYWEVFECLIEDNLMENCTVVLKVLSEETFPGHHLQITAKNAMQNCGFVGDKWKGNAYVLADTKLGGRGMKKGIADVRTKLLAAELKETVTGPVKETVSAGKSLVKAGHTLARWLGRLVKSN